MIGADHGYTEEGSDEDEESEMINPNTGVEWTWADVVTQLVGDEIVLTEEKAGRIADWMVNVGLIDE